MDPQLKHELEQIHALARDNHTLLRAVRRHQIIEMWGKWVFWLIVIAGSVYWTVTYLQPMAVKFQTASGVGNSGPFGLPTSADIQKLINSYQAGQK